jgi:integrase
MSIRDEEGKPVVNRNPVKVLSQRRLWHDEKPRREVIPLHGLEAWWKAVQALDSAEVERAEDGRFAEGTAAFNSNAETVRDFLIFLLLTGLRRNEAATLKWENVDLKAKMFTIPTTKNKEPHTLPLSDYLFDMLKRRHSGKERETDQVRAPYVFSGDTGPLAEPKKQIAKVVAASGVPFSSHTLRRTFGTIAESLDIPYLALKRLLNHKVQDVTGEHYTVISVERLREPMQKITDFVLKAAGVRSGAEVVPIRTRKSRTAPAR